MATVFDLPHLHMVDKSTRAADFGKWLAGTLRDRNMSRADLARRMRIERSNVSRWANGHILPDPTTCSAIAHALDLDPIEVLAAAGWANRIDGERERLIALVRDLPEVRVADALQFLRFLVQQGGGE